MMQQFLIAAGLLALLAGTANAIDWEGLAPADGNGQDAREMVVESLLAEEAPCLEWPHSRPLLGSAAGGVLGWVYPQLYLWYPGLYGDIWSEEDNKLDLRDDLGLDSSEFVILPELQFNYWLSGIRLSGFQSKFSGAGTIQGSFNFGGVDYIFGEQAASEFRINNYRLTFLFTPLKTDVVVLGIQGGISYYDIDATITGQVSGEGSESGDLPVPLIGALVQAKLGDFLLELDVAGFSIDIDDVDATVIEVQAMVGYTFIDVIGVHLGYRYQSFEGRTDDLSVDSLIHGPYIGASVRF